MYSKEEPFSHAGNRPLDAVLSALVQTLQPPEGDHSRSRSQLDGTADPASINAADAPAEVAAAGKEKGKGAEEKVWELPRCELSRTFLQIVFGCFKA